MAIDLKAPCPPKYVDDAFNPDWGRWQYGKLQEKVQGFYANDDEIPKNWNTEQFRKAIDADIRAHGAEPEHLQDLRTPEQMALDAVKRLIEAPDSILEMSDEEIDAIEKAMDLADKGCEDIIDKRKDDIREQARRAAVGKRWRRTLNRVRRLQERAREPMPARSFKGRGPALKSAHLLRFMLYCGRRGTSATGGAEAVFQFGPHLYAMAVDIWEAENRVGYACYPGKEPEIVTGDPDFDYQGIIMVCPPGHFKTTLATWWVTKRVAKRRRTQGINLHAIAEKAEETLQAVRSNFDVQYAVGRRTRAIYPDVRFSKNDNNRGKMRVWDPNPPKSPTLTATGVGNKGLGSDADFLLLDDVVPQQDAHQETERVRRKQHIGGTWMSRLRHGADDCFVFWIGNTWHKGDAMMSYIADSRANQKRSGQNKTRPFRVSIQRCGGPQENFRPLCEWAASAKILRGKYQELGPNLYAAAYQCNPIVDGNRIVGRLRFYDPMDQQHQEFLNSATRHASLDSAASAREKSDRSGIVYGAVGQVRWVQDGVNHYETRLRVTHAEQIRATQSDVVDHIAVKALGPDGLDYIHLELVSNSYGIMEMFENRFRITPIAHSPQNRSKEIRLRRAAPMLDDSGWNKGGPRAVVEFPGVRQADGSIAPDPEYAGLVEQILDFGAAAEDHLVDAITQITNWLVLDGQLTVGRGAVTEQVLRAIEAPDDDAIRRQRLRRLFKGNKPQPGLTAMEEDERYMASMN